MLINYGNDTTAVITDAESIDRLKVALSQAAYQPTSYCFCINTPELVLMAGEEELVRVTVPHGEKLRFSGKTLSGDFKVSPATVDSVSALAKEKQALGVKQARAIPPKPVPLKKIELKP